LKRAILGLLLLGTAGLWGWAHFWPKPPDPLDPRYQGEFRLYRYEPAQGRAAPNPFEHLSATFTFRADGTYLIRHFVATGQELFRLEGLVELTGANELALTQLSENRRPSPHPSTEHFQVSWGQDQGGEFLQLTSRELGYQLYLRP